jgi:hypothetical protein
LGKLVAKRVKQSETQHPRFINRPWAVFPEDGNYITIDQRDPNLTVVFFTYHSKALQDGHSAVVLEKNKPLRRTTQYITNRDEWDLYEDTKLERVILRDCYRTLRGASLFKPDRDGQWHGMYPDLDGVKYALGDLPPGI